MLIAINVSESTRTQMLIYYVFFFLFFFFFVFFLSNNKQSDHKHSVGYISSRYNSHFISFTEQNQLTGHRNYFETI